MVLTLSTARLLAPFAFTLDLAAQIYGMISNPNMKHIHDANLSFYSPQPFFIAGFFLPQQIFQLAWLYTLWKAGRSTQSRGGKDVATMIDYVPYYTIGNLCIASWMIFWNHSMLKSSNMFVVINSFAQLYYIFIRLPAMNLDSQNSVLTHLVSKTFAGIGVLDLLHNGAVAYFNHNLNPSTTVQILTAVGFGALASCSDWIFGSCLVYDLIALSVGQSMYGDGRWGRLLGFYAAGTAMVVAVRNLLRRPYVHQGQAEYESVAPVERADD